MNEMIAYCGLACHDCEAFIATMNQDNEKRRIVAEKWSKEFNTNLKAEDIHCTGCISQSNNLFNHCQVCAIRKCGIEKGVLNCAYCDDFPCQKLNDFFIMVPGAKVKLSEIRSKII
jgi:hypothetical protein